MKLFLDANILVSVLNHELPTFTYTSRILSLPEYKPKYKLFTTPICLAIAFYFAEKKCGNKRALEKIWLLSTKLEVINVGQKEVAKATSDKKVQDFEDGMQYYAALHSKCDIIITEDVDDYYFSDLKVHSSEDFLINHFQM